MPDAAAPQTLVLGLGNPIMGDDGTGLAALARLRERYAFDDEVHFEDGGTWGLTLLPLMEDAARILLLDAINTNAPPGSLVRLEGAAIPRALVTKVSPHQMDMREVLALMELRGTVPRDLVALGVQPLAVELSTELSPPVRRRLDALVALAVAQLRAWGHACRPGGAAVACTS